MAGYTHPTDIILSGPHYGMELNADGHPALRTTSNGSARDAFGRLRVAQPITLFESSHIFEENREWSSNIVNTSGNVTVAHNANSSTMELTIGTSSGDTIIRETKRVFPYQPGKGLLQLSTVVMDEPKANLRQRAGMFTTENGIYVEQDGLDINMVLRSYSTGSLVETRVAQADWSGDPLDGTGPSGITLDLSKIQIFWSDVEWLGAGTARCGFIIDGSYITVHKFHHANEISQTYMTTATLPLRYEIVNTGVTDSDSVMGQICSTVISEGGFNPVGTGEWYLGPSKSIGVAWTPIVSVRLDSAHLNAAIIPGAYQVFPEDTGIYEIALFLNADLTGATFADSSFSHVDIDTAATTLANGLVIDYSFASSTNQSAAVVNSGDTLAVFQRQLGRTVDGVSDVVTIAAKKTTGTGNVLTSIKLINLT